MKLAALTRANLRTSQFWNKIRWSTVLGSARRPVVPDRYVTWIEVDRKSVLDDQLSVFANPQRQAWYVTRSRDGSAPSDRYCGGGGNRIWGALGASESS